ncbi:MAG TPA: hypothetical protein PKC13_02635 [Blastocatellia bacterium]|nr:hypothetical protein [Blastocatellia bacterium]HMY70412.1 hypothetical protein [Blastocatellia bacterium]
MTDNQQGVTYRQARSGKSFAAPEFIGEEQNERQPDKRPDFGKRPAQVKINLFLPAAIIPGGLAGCLNYLFHKRCVSA